jgi:hypothetical protein
MPTLTPNVKESLPEAEKRCVNPAVPALLQPKISKNQPRLLSLPKKERNNAFGEVGKQASVPKKRKSRNSGWKPPKQAVAIAYNVKRQAQKPKMKKA